MEQKESKCIAGFTVVSKELVFEGEFRAGGGEFWLQWLESYHEKSS